MHYITTMSELESITSAHKFVIVDFYTDYCPPCKANGPEFERLSREDEMRVFVKCDASKAHDLATACEVYSVPTFIAFINGKEVARMNGGGASKLQAFIRSNL